MRIPHRIIEGFENRKFKPGQANFPSSTLADPFLQQMLALITQPMTQMAQTKGVPVPDANAFIVEKIAKFNEMAAISPLLYGTIAKNIAEQEVFKLFCSVPLDPPGSSFSNTMFHRLIRNIRADQDEFWPLRSFIDKRRLENPVYEYDENPIDFYQSTPGISTAAATPSGRFIFNTNFMQKLIDWAHHKQLKSKGRKYESNGGDIPDDWGYIEFVIMHEFMHFSHDDFYYQKILPKANSQIINWVGDFRTNYLLVKSGYEALPIGLYNDNINYDRQKTYDEMYNIVKAEFDKMPKDKQQQGSDALNESGDDHRRGEKEGQDGEPTDATSSDIDENGKTIEKQMEESKDTNPAERAEKDKQAQANKPGGEAGNPGKGKGTDTEIDYSKIMPKFNWQSIVKKFLSTAKPRTEETYARPARRSITGMDIARQVGAAAIKPAERPMDFSDAMIGFVFDSSGSMGGVIAKVYSNAVNLLRQPAFKKTECAVFKFSSGFDIFKCNFFHDKAAKVSTFAEKPKQYGLKAKDVFNIHMAGGTEFTSTLASEIKSAQNSRYNLIFFLDSDILATSNLTNFVSVIKNSPLNTFVIFNDRDTYISFRTATNIATANMTYFAD